MMDKKIYENMRKHNKYLSDYACTDDKVIRFEKESEDFRPGFFRDIDRIIHSSGCKIIFIIESITSVLKKSNINIPIPAIVDIVTPPKIKIRAYKSPIIDKYSLSFAILFSIAF